MRITKDKLAKLLTDNFARIHRSIIVNLKHIREMQVMDKGDHQVTLLCHQHITLSRHYRNDIKSLVSFTY